MFGANPRQPHRYAISGTLQSWRNAITLLFGYEVESSESFPLCGELDAACLLCVLALFVLRGLIVVGIVAEGKEYLYSKEVV